MTARRANLPLTTAKNVPVGGTVSCTDVENDTLDFRIGDSPEKGTVSAFDTSSGEFTYTPNLNTSGADSFTVIANDGLLDSVPPALVGIGVDDEAPMCSGDTSSANEDTVQVGDLDCDDADGDTLFYEIVGQPAHGSAAINTTSGHWTYTPDADYNGTDSFTAGASDGACRRTRRPST